MTSIKDKLASSVRQAKTGAEPAPAAEKAEANKTPRSTSATSTKEASTKEVSTEPAPADSLAAEPPPSIEELFPDRIWPD
jgi:hypothetical protein